MVPPFLNVIPISSPKRCEVVRLNSNGSHVHLGFLHIERLSLMIRPCLPLVVCWYAAPLLWNFMVIYFSWWRIFNHSLHFTTDCNLGRAKFSSGFTRRTKPSQHEAIKQVLTINWAFTSTSVTRRCRSPLKKINFMNSNESFFFLSLRQGSYFEKKSKFCC